MTELHFLRPLWLLAIIPALLLTIQLWRQRMQSAGWQNAISPELLTYLLESTVHQKQRWPWYCLFIAWCLLSIAMAGPTWNKLPQPVHQQQDALVIVLDLSLSMFAEDVSPSRLQRAQHKIHDILKLRKEGKTAMVAYSGDAHIVSPLTDDNDTISNMVPALSPEVMPIYGSNPVAAFELAQSLLKQAGVNQGRLLWLTDDITESNIGQLEDTLQSGVTLSILAIGTEQGAPIKAKQGFLKDDTGNIIVPKLHKQRLHKLASNTNARYSELRVDDSDIQYLMANSQLDLAEQTVATEHQFDQWQDRGPWLVWLVLPIALLAFRRGWLLCLPLLALINPNPSYALDWQDLWQRSDQQGAKALQQGEPEKAAELFNNSEWQAAANYKAGKFEKAAEQYADNNNASSHYNHGNALARSGKLQEALDAYQKALELEPKMADAQFNHDIVEKQLAQQQSQSSDQQNSDQDDSDQNKQDDQQPPQSSKDQNSNQSEQDQQQNSESDQNKSSSNQNQPNSDQDSEQSSTEQQGQEQQNPDKTEDSKSDESKQQEAEQKKESSQDASEPTEPSPDAKQQQQRQATEQWLRQIPDDPSGLLRNKFRYQHQLRRQQQQLTDEDQPQW